MWLRRIAGILPTGVRSSLARRRRLKFAYEWTALQATSRCRCALSRLGRFADGEFRDALAGAEWEAWWRAADEETSGFQLSGPHGTSRACRRAIFHLAMLLKPRRVLEIGTYVGSTTIVWHQAARRLKSELQSESLTIDTVDILDVNDDTTGPWAHNGARCPPREAIRQLGSDDMVRFHVADSLDFMTQIPGGGPYDLIFLDGDHAAARVYREVCAATGLLRQEGHILLHDYYPPAAQRDPQRQHVLYGPYLAVRRLMRENPDLAVHPFGEMPWKEAGNRAWSSLALLSRRDR